VSYFEVVRILHTCHFKCEEGAILKCIEWQGMGPFELGLPCGADLAFLFYSGAAANANKALSIREARVKMNSW